MQCKTNYFVRSGRLNIPINSKPFGRAGHSGGYWSKTTLAGDKEAYFSAYSSVGVAPSENNLRNVGYPLRCLAS